MSTATQAAAEDSRLPIKLKRGSVACKRCRRLRSKCTHENSIPPCLSCKNAGKEAADECVFLRRGEDSSDRDYRAKRPRVGEPGRRSVTATSKFGEITTLPAVTCINNDPDSLLPPYEALVEGCQVFVSSYFQLGFIPKAVFLERLANDRESVSVFLLLSMLSISARFTPSLVRMFGDGLSATETFMRRATSLVPGEMYKPTLERTQGFFLLSTAEWGHGDRDRSFMHMGIAVRMAGLLQLHREETYRLPNNHTPEDVIKAEVARRTFWMIESQSNLQSGLNVPSAFSLSDISTLLPCDEKDFAFGFEPLERASLIGSASPQELTSLPSRSLFATLIQAHGFWGQVARRACQWENCLPDRSGSSAVPMSSQLDDLARVSSAPWDRSSGYHRLASSLSEWERNLPERHRWSVQNLRGYRAESVDLAYLSVTMVIRLSSIVIRRIYLPFIAVALKVIEQSSTSNNTGWGPAPQLYWKNMSEELFNNVHDLYEQISASFPFRTRGSPPILVFCVYICGSLASYLCKWPQLCPSVAPHAYSMFHKALNVLTDLQHAWPKARPWQNALAMAATLFPQQDTSSCDEVLEPRVTHPSHTSTRTLESSPSPSHGHTVALTSSSKSSRSGPNMLYQLAVAATHDQTDTPPRPSVFPGSPSPLQYPRHSSYGSSYDSGLRRAQRGVNVADAHTPEDGSCFPRVDGRTLYDAFQHPQGIDLLSNLGAQLSAFFQGSEIPTAIDSNSIFTSF